MLNKIVCDVRAEQGMPVLNVNDYPFQRNQNQSAVGGDDLSNPFGLSIEVKRQESLSIPAWWKQSVESARRTGGVPILLFRQNHKPWRCRMLVEIPFCRAQGAHRAISGVPAELSIDHFQYWFTRYYKAWLETNQREHLHQES